MAGGLPNHAQWGRAGRSWIPRDEPSCGVWLRADLGVSFGSGGRVANWTNQAKWGAAFGQAVLTKQPSYSATGFGATSMPSLGFAASLTSSLATVTNAINQAAGNYTLIFACNPTLTSGNGGLWLLDVTVGRIICADFQTSTNTVAYFDGAQYRGTKAPTLGAQILSFELAPNAGAIYRNGTALDTGLTWAQKALGGVLTLGTANGGGGSYFEGALAEVAILQNPSSGARSKVERYMGRRYGITVA